jgi:hypothetical protein
VESIVMARPAEYGNHGSSEGRGPWGGRWSRDEPAPPRLPPARPAHVHAPGEIVVEYEAEDSSSPMGLQVGVKLRHPSFGVGEVRGWQGGGADLKVTMRFPGTGVKTILARFLSKP